MGVRRERGQPKGARFPPEERGVSLREPLFLLRWLNTVPAVTSVAESLFYFYFLAFCFVCKKGSRSVTQACWNSLFSTN